MTAFHLVAEYHGFANIAKRTAPIRPAPIVPLTNNSGVVHFEHTYGVFSGPDVSLQAPKWT